MKFIQSGVLQTHLEVCGEGGSCGCGAVTGDKSHRAQPEVQIPYGKVLVKTGLSWPKTRRERAGGI